MKRPGNAHRGHRGNAYRARGTARKEDRAVDEHENKRARRARSTLTDRRMYATGAIHDQHASASLRELLLEFRQQHRQGAVEDGGWRYVEEFFACNATRSGPTAHGLNTLLTALDFVMSPKRKRAAKSELEEHIGFVCRCTVGAMARTAAR